jgi:hypothetical protein
MNHSRTQDLKPSGALTDLTGRIFSAAFKARDIDLSAGLNERKIGRAQTNPRLLTENFASKKFERPLVMKLILILEI